MAYNDSSSEMQPVSSKESQKLLFSNFREAEFEQLSEALSSVFQVTLEELQSFYTQWQQTFEIPGYPKDPRVKREIFQSVDPKCQAQYKASPIVGIDLPSILELDNGNSQKPTLVLLGQDPKRSYNEQEKEIGLATPYGLQMRGCREEKKETKVYFKFIEVLLKKGFRVYLTDIWKIWIANPDELGTAVQLRKKDRDRFAKVLEAEITIFQPLAVITWGTKAKNCFQSFNLNIHHVNSIHPSGAAGGAWAECLGAQKANLDNKLAYWEQKIEQELPNVQ